MKTKSVFNFSSGPAMLPTEVLQQAKQDLCNWNGLGISIMEISHRSKEFINLANTVEQDLRKLLVIPLNYKVLFCHGGARAQFAAVPMNLLGKTIKADYINSGYWSHSAIIEAQKYCKPRIIDVTIKAEKYAIKPMCEWDLSTDSTYVHYCPNETIDGLAINELPNFRNKIVVADFSSTILSRPLAINRFGIIYAGAQKNIGPAGLTLVIVREDLLGHACKVLPSIFDYSILAKNKSMFNTPPTFAWYLAGLVFKWLQDQGGLAIINKRNHAKANLLYNTIDNSDFYHNNIASSNRSCMNVPFQLANNKLNELFLKESFDSGLYALKGHPVVGNMRASIYNAMPLAGVQALVNFMKYFAHRYG